MKRHCVLAAVLLFAALLPCSSLVSQWVWSAPRAITDSLADNTNAMVKEIQFGEYYDFYVFWERAENEDATAIYFRRLYPLDAPAALLEAPGVHYRNPRIVEAPYWSGSHDTLFYFFYESDEAGNSDIYYMAYTTDGFREPVVLAGTPEEETNFRCNDNGSLIWQEGDKIRFAQADMWPSGFTLTGPVTIDSIGCSHPDVSGDDGFIGYTLLNWLKVEGQGGKVYYSHYQYTSGTLSGPYILSDAGDNRSLRFANWACGGYAAGPEVMCWESIEDGVHTIHAMDPYWGWQYTSLFTQEGFFSPMISQYMIPVDGMEVTGFMTFVGSEVQNGDIFVNEEGWYIPQELEGFINLSDSPYEERNPAFFNGWCFVSFCDLFLIWESYQNGHWQLYSSMNELFCWGGVAENTEVPAVSLDISPNPCRGRCDLHYHLAESGNVTLTMTTMDGRQLTLFNQKFHEKGDHVYRLELDRVTGRPGFTGLVIVRVSTGNDTASGKIIVLD